MDHFFALWHGLWATGQEESPLQVWLDTLLVNASQETHDAPPDDACTVFVGDRTVWYVQSPTTLTCWLEDGDGYLVLSLLLSDIAELLTMDRKEAA